MTVSRRLGALLLAALLLVVGCGPAASPAPSGAASPGGSPSPSEPGGPVSPSVTAAGPSASPTLAEGQFKNPVITDDFPDPFVLKDGDTYYAYATGLQLAKSTDLVEWDVMAPLQIQGTWAIRDFWAPEVIKTSAGYVMYHTGRHLDLKRANGENTLCIGVAIAPSPEGPFVDKLGKPLVCQNELGGTIDAGPYKDIDGKLYLVFKNDGNCCNIPTRFYIQQLTPDGLKLTGKRTDLGVKDDAGWVADVIGAPVIVHRDGTYFLFYSANAYYKSDYAVGYATSKSLTGPYKDAPENPILHSDAKDLREDPERRSAGPGHQMVIEDDDGDLWMVYHSWDRDAVGYDRGGTRTMWIDELVFEGGKPVVKGPDHEPQPVP